MEAIAIQPGTTEAAAGDSFAAENRETLQKAHVYGLLLCGTPGSGKTSLIEATASRLSGEARIGAIVCRNSAARDTERLQRWCKQVQAVDAGNLDAKRVHEALKRLDLSQIDLLLIEDVADFADAPPSDFGQNGRVAVFSVTGGDDKADEYPHRAADSDAVVLTKTDLLVHVPFSLQHFRADVARLNPHAPVIELSVFQHGSMEPWFEWIRREICKRPENRAATLPNGRHPESFLG